MLTLPLTLVFVLQSERIGRQWRPYERVNNKDGRYKLLKLYIIHRYLVDKIGANLMKTEEAIQISDIIVMAIPKDFYKEQPLHLLEGKTVIDCSNRSSVKSKENLSQAEYLESLVPESANVVKAFNVLSAYSLESGGIQGNYLIAQ